jgi:hypothetical protein
LKSAFFLKDFTKPLIIPAPENNHNELTIDPENCEEINPTRKRNGIQ